MAPNDRGYIEQNTYIESVNAKKEQGDNSMLIRLLVEQRRIRQLRQRHQLLE
jgi:hypothetical protein